MRGNLLPRWARLIMPALLGAVVATSLQAQPVFFAGTGNFYEFVNTPMNWSAARDAAAARTHQSAGVVYAGYLATIESAAEQSFLETAFGRPDGWLGGTDDGNEGVWRWVTGPYENAPAVFWANGATVTYANWNTGEPNNPFGIEHHLEFGFMQGRWNDLRGEAAKAFYVEYAPIPEPAGTLLLLLMSVAALLSPRRRHRQDRAFNSQEGDRQ